MPMMAACPSAIQGSAEVSSAYADDGTPVSLSSTSRPPPPPNEQRTTSAQDIVRSCDDAMIDTPCLTEMRYAKPSPQAISPEQAQ